MLDITPLNPESVGAKWRVHWLTRGEDKGAGKPKDLASVPPSLALPSAKVWRMTATDVQPVAGDTHEPTGERTDLGQVLVTCIDHRWTRNGAIRVFQVVGGGKFDRFEIAGPLPESIEAVAKPKKPTEKRK